MSSYKNDIRKYHNNCGTLSFTELIETLVVLYGFHNEENYNKYLSEEELDSMSNNILTKDVADLAYFIMNTPGATDKLNWHYDVSSGETFITSV